MLVIFLQIRSKPYLSSKGFSVLAVLLMALWFSGSIKAETQGVSQSFLDIPIEELIGYEVIVTSVAKKPQSIADAAAAVFVITQDDIRQSGVTTIPDALRMVPGLQVAQIDANKWAISARGFNTRLSNKLLVLMDGRTLYNNLFSGVYWESQNAQMENIERIEVIRGPAAALWGANAVNGVINIITQSAEKTQETFVRARAGSEEFSGFIRHGGKLGEQAHYRLYADYRNQDDGVDAIGHDGSDQWDLGQGGGRLDWQIDNINHLTLQADYQEGEVGTTQRRSPLLEPPFSQVLDQKVKITGGNILARWRHDFDQDNQLTIQSYYDYVHRESSSIETTFVQTFHTFDIELNHRFKAAQNYEVNWGLGYRLIADELKGKRDIILTPDSRNPQLFSGFIHNEIALVPDKLKAILAIRLEHNDFSGFEYQPSARLIWTPTRQHSIWAAASRAVRTPVRDSDLQVNRVVIPGDPPTLFALVGSTNESEEVIAYELGYKFNMADVFDFDIAAYYHIYDDLHTFERNAPVVRTNPDHILIAIPFEPMMKGEAYGVEVASTLDVTPWWQLHGTYTYSRLNLKLKNGSVDSSSLGAEGLLPQQQFSIRSNLQMSEQWQSSLWVRYVDALPTQDLSAYITMDARLAWQPAKQFELSVVGRNLLDTHFPEFQPEIFGLTPSQVERSVYGQIVWRF